jgi:uncharacterized membrane protein
MFLKKHLKDPNRMICLGMMFLIPASLMNLLAHHAQHWSDLGDGVMGFFYGLTISLTLMGVWLKGRQRHDA